MKLLLIAISCVCFARSAVDQTSFTRKTKRFIAEHKIACVVGAGVAVLAGYAAVQIIRFNAIKKHIKHDLAIFTKANVDTEAAEYAKNTNAANSAELIKIADESKRRASDIMRDINEKSLSDINYHICLAKAFLFNIDNDLSKLSTIDIIFGRNKNQYIGKTNCSLDYSIFVIYYGVDRYLRIF